MAAMSSSGLVCRRGSGGGSWICASSRTGGGGSAPFMEVRNPFDIHHMRTPEITMMTASTAPVMAMPLTLISRSTPAS